MTRRAVAPGRPSPAGRPGGRTTPTRVGGGRALSGEPGLVAWLGLVLATALAYIPAWHGGVLWDDIAHLTRADLQPAGGLWRIWFELGATQQYYPVVHSAFWLMHRVWGEDPLGYHLVNIGLHATSAWLLWRLLRRLSVPGAAIGAVAFALHPVQVESVAWMTELKNTLSGLLYLAAALSYLQFDASRRRSIYAGATLLFAAALLAKSMTATLPVSLGILLWWQRGRLRWKDDLAPLLPWLAMGAASGALTAWIERTTIGAEGAQFAFSAAQRVLIAGRAIGFYASTLVWPARLSFIYPRWTVDPAVWWQWLFPAGVAGLAAGLWIIRGRSRAPLVVLALFVTALMPALGFVNVYPFLYSFVADHFQYLASMAALPALAAAIVQIARRVTPFAAADPGDRTRGHVALLIAAVGLGALTWRQAGDYVNAETLYRVTLARNPDAWLAHNNLGVIIEDRAFAQSPADAAGLKVAIDEFKAALRLNPTVARAHLNLGTALQAVGRTEEARAAFTEAARLEPRNAGTWNSLGTALAQEGRTDDALAAFDRAIALSPTPGMQINKGIALMRAERPGEAEAAFRAALQLDPTLARAYVGLASTLESTGRLDAATIAYRDALRYQPDADTHNALGIVFAELGRRSEAAAEFREALRLQPGHADARANLDRLK